MTCMWCLDDTLKTTNSFVTRKSATIIAETTTAHAMSTPSSDIEIKALDSNTNVESYPNVDIVLSMQSEVATPDREPNACFQIIVWIRVSIIIFSILLFILSMAYSLAQLVDTKLAIFQLCPEPPQLEEVYQHSFETSLERNGEMEINNISHWGLTNEDCWKTRRIDISTDSIWYSNQYDWEWKDGINGKFILFGLLSLLWIVVIFYGAISLTMDLILSAQGILHTKSSLYGSHIRKLQKQRKATSIEDEHKPSRNGRIKRFIKWYLGMYFKHFAVDTAGFVFTKFASETTEFVIQSVALLKYNGYFRDLAVKPDAVTTFASILAFNMFGSGMLWSLYAMFPTQCHGLIFKRSLFFVDKVSDLMYTLFPIYVIISDDYNSNTSDLMILLGQLSLDGWYFITAFAPSLYLCINCLVMTITSRIRMKNEHFRRWKLISPNNDQSTTTNTIGTSAASQREWDTNWIHKGKLREIRTSKRVLIGIISVIFVAVGLFSLIFTVNHTNEAIEHCSSVEENVFFTNGSLSVYPSDSQQSLLSTNPELFVWNHCIYKVYPFINDERYRCQCRVFQIHWDYDMNSNDDMRKQYLNITRGDMLKGVMTNWFMMEKFQEMGGDLMPTECRNITFNLLRNAVYLKALAWDEDNFDDTEPLDEDLFAQWTELEYLYIGHTHTFPELPASFGQLTSLRYLELKWTEISNILPLICSLTSLEVFWSTYELQTEDVPQCLDSVKTLKLFIIDVSYGLTSFPVSMLSLPQLGGFSLFRNGISWDSLLEGNLPSNIDRNDTHSVMEWLDEHFIFSNDTDYYLAQNPICYENLSFVIPRIADFIERACAFPAELVDIPIDKQMCSPWVLG